MPNTGLGGDREWIEEMPRQFMFDMLLIPCLSSVLCLSLAVYTHTYAKVNISAQLLFTRELFSVLLSLSPHIPAEIGEIRRFPFSICCGAAMPQHSCHRAPEAMATFCRCCL